MRKKIFWALIALLALVCGTALAADVTIDASTLTQNSGSNSDPWYTTDHALVLKNGYNFTISGTLPTWITQVRNDGTIMDGAFGTVYNYGSGIIEDGTFNFAFNYGTIQGGTFTVFVENRGAIEGGTFSGAVQNTEGKISGNATFSGSVSNIDSSTIEGGIFNGNVTNKATISGGTFNGKLTNESGGTIINATLTGEIDAESGSEFEGCTISGTVLTADGDFVDCDFSGAIVPCDVENPAMAGIAKLHKEEYKRTTYNNDASCTTDGTNTVYCDACGTVLGTETALGSAKGHLFSDYIDDNNADCVNDGTKTASCQRAGCNAKVIMVIKNSALGHDFQPDLENSRPATCVEPGKEVTTCTRCGETFFKATPMVEHTVVDLPAVEPTCTATGLTLGAKCGVCGKNMVLQEEIPMLAHTPEEVPAVAPTYTKPGYTAGVKCAVCGALLSGCEEIGVLTPKLSGLALMRKGASQDAGIYFPLLQPSQSFSIIGEMENYFYPIMLVNGTVGWLHYSYVA